MYVGLYKSWLRRTDQAGYDNLLYSSKNSPENRRNFRMRFKCVLHQRILENEELLKIREKSSPLNIREKLLLLLPRLPLAD